MTDATSATREFFSPMYFFFAYLPSSAFNAVVSARNDLVEISYQTIICNVERSVHPHPC